LRTELTEGSAHVALLAMR